MSFDFWLAISSVPLRDVWRRMLLDAGWKPVVPDPPSLRGMRAQVRGIVLVDLSGLGGGHVTVGEFKRDSRDMPLVLTSPTQLPDSVLIELFNTGIDDYIPGNLDPRLKLAKIRALLRRVPGAAVQRPGASASSSGNLRINPAMRIVETSARGGKWAPLARLTPIEYRVLDALLRYAGVALDRDFLIQSVWSERAAKILPATLDKHVESLRRKLGRRASRLRTVYGVGYAYIEEAAR